MKFKWILLIFLGACKSTTQTEQAGLKSSSDIIWQNCEQTPLPSHSNVPWKNIGNRTQNAVAKPDHRSNDGITTTGHAESFVVRSFFGWQVGPLRTPIIGEDIASYLDTCGNQLVELGQQTTDKKGQVDTILDPKVVGNLGPGVYKLHHKLLANGQNTPSYLHILPRGQKAAMIDIDGTLTTGDSEVYQEAFKRYLSESIDATIVLNKLSSWFQDNLSYVGKAYEGASDFTKRIKERGYYPLYITGRPFIVNELTRNWLAQLPAAKGYIKLAPTLNDALPSNENVGAYKVRELRSIQSKGIDIVIGVGNSTTDIFAFATHGIALDKSFIIGKNAGKDGTVAFDSYQNFPWENIPPAQ